MSDFSTISIAPACTLFPEEAHTGEWFQSKDMPDDEEMTCCVDGQIDPDGRFIRNDARGRCWNPTLNGWIKLHGECSDTEWLCLFVDGCVAEVRKLSGLSLDDRGASCSPNNWVSI